MDHTNEYNLVFEQLKQILLEYAPRMQVKIDDPISFSLDSHLSKKFNKELFFGAVKIQKRYVSYHLMPIYMFPDLLKDISPTLRKHMQGKSCFNFNSMDETLFKELSALTRQSFERVKQEELI